MDSIKKHKKSLIIGISILTAFQLLSYIKDYIIARRLQKRASLKLSIRNSSHFDIPLISSELKQQILQERASELTHSLQSGKYSLEDVLYTYIERSQSLGRLLNLSAEELFIESSLQLKSLPNGPLFGLPISIKDEIFQVNCHSSGGLIKNINKLDPDDSILVSLIKQAGGVPFVRANLMQLVMWLECTNHIYGRADNPWDPKRTTGGSSGGSAGLIAAGCCVLSIGSDIGGSIRIPAAFCGVYGFKPSSSRSSSFQTFSSNETATSPFDILVSPSYGPIGRCVDDLALVLKVWWTDAMWKKDHVVVPLKFNEKVFEDKKKMRIGIMDFNGVVDCAAVVTDVIRKTAEKLRDDGHEIVEFKNDLFEKASELFIRSAFSSDPSFLLEILDGEYPSWPYLMDYLDAKIPLFRYFSKRLLQVTGFKLFYKFMSKTKPLNLKEFCMLQHEIAAFKFEFNEYWQSLQIDALVCPIWPLVAPFHETTIELAPMFSYEFVWNLLDYPAGSMPIRKVEPGENVYESKLNDISVEYAKKTMENSVGLPVSLQVVASPFQDENALRVMKIIEGYYKFYERPNLD